jgi:hypothetical protein
LARHEGEHLNLISLPAIAKGFRLGGMPGKAEILFAPNEFDALGRNANSTRAARVGKNSSG